TAPALQRRASAAHTARPASAASTPPTDVTAVVSRRITRSPAAAGGAVHSVTPVSAGAALHAGGGSGVRREGTRHTHRTASGSGNSGAAAAARVTNRQGGAGHS